MDPNQNQTPLVSVPVTSSPLAPSSVSPPVPAPSKTVVPQWLVFVVSGALILLLALGVFFFFYKPTKKPAAAPSAATQSVIDISSLSAAYDSLSGAGIKEFTPEHKASTLATYAELAKDFQIKPEFLQDKTNNLLALSVAQLATTASAAEKVQYSDELYLLAKPYLKNKPARIIDEDQASSITGDQAKAVYAKYTDAPLTQEVEAAIDSRKLVLQPSSVQPYELHVMNFQPKSNQETAFVGELKETGWVPSLWNDKRDGFNYIVLSKTEAETFLAGNNDSINALFWHEYTHSQINYLRGSALTRVLEEYRAEHFSGDKGAYYDVKQFVIYATVFSGYDITAAMDKYPTDPYSFYLDLYNGLGIAEANKIVIASPNLYLQDATTPVKAVQALTVGYDGALQGAYVIGQTDRVALNARINARAKRLIEIMGSKQAAIDDLKSYTGGVYKLDFAAQKLTDYINTNM
jgi:hypothetical protein